MSACRRGQEGACGFDRSMDRKPNGAAQAQLCRLHSKTVLIIKLQEILFV